MTIKKYCFCLGQAFDNSRMVLRQLCSNRVVSLAAVLTTFYFCVDPCFRLGIPLGKQKIANSSNPFTGVLLPNTAFLYKTQLWEINVGIWQTNQIKVIQTRDHLPLSLVQKYMSVSGTLCYTLDNQ